MARCSGCGCNLTPYNESIIDGGMCKNCSDLKEEDDDEKKKEEQEKSKK